MVAGDAGRRPRVRREPPAALLDLGARIVDDGDYVEALAVLDDMLRQGPSPSYDMAVASFLKAVALDRLGDRGAALRTVDGLIEQYGDSPDKTVLVIVADALALKTDIFGRAGLGADAIIAEDELLQRFGDAVEAEFRERSASALAGKAYWLLHGKRVSEALRVSDQLIRYYTEENDPQTRRHISHLLLQHVEALLAARLRPGSTRRSVAASTVALPLVVASHRLLRSRGAKTPSDHLGAIEARRRRYVQALKISDLVLDTEAGDDTESQRLTSLARRYQRVTEVVLGQARRS